MARFTVSIAVLVGFIAGQMAAVPHTHVFASFAEQHEHDARPHVHVGYAHDHDHDGHGGHDTGDGQQQVPDGYGAKHDGSAIYVLTESVLVVVQNSQTQQPQADSCTVKLASTTWADDTAITAIPWHPPDNDFPARPLFLTLRTLRI